MPNYGRTGRCLTCKKRHVKCDEARPSCSQCRRLGFECGGYSKNYAFRDQSYKFTAATKTLKEQPNRSLLNAADVAVPFFLTHYAGMGRRLAAARGFYEILIPTYNTQSPDSPLSLAVSAVALKVFFTLWQRRETPSAPYIEAIASLRSALERPEDRRNPATALAVLALHLYESISAVYDARQATPVHHHGALSLLPIATLDSLDGMINAHVKGFVIHSEISSALRQKRSIHPNVHSYMNNPNDSSLVPGNHSSTLDSIGAFVAELQEDYVRGLSRPHASSISLEQQCRAWITEAERIDENLQAWERQLPDHWRPLRITTPTDFDSSITAYRSACDIYPSCQIATLWNLWRFHRLLLLKITTVATQYNTKLLKAEFMSNQQLIATPRENAIRAELIQHLVDSICHTIPFYLGNRTEPSTLSDFEDPNIFFPSYHSLSSEYAKKLAAARHRNRDDITLSKDEHHRHMVAYGAWHAVSPLSNLLTLFSDDYGGKLVTNCLRPGQQDWIREQFLRVSTLVRLPTANRCFGVDDHLSSTSLSPLDPKSPDSSAAEDLAKQVRKGARFMSGP